MKSLKKRILSGAMAGVLALSMAVPAFAEDPAPTNTTTVFTGAYQEADIAVTVPGAVEAFLNPYGRHHRGGLGGNQGKYHWADREYPQCHHQ